VKAFHGDVKSRPSEGLWQVSGNIRKQTSLPAEA